MDKNVSLVSGACLTLRCVSFIKCILGPKAILISILYGLPSPLSQYVIPVILRVQASMLNACQLHMLSALLTGFFERPPSEKHLRRVLRNATEGCVFLSLNSAELCYKNKSKGVYSHQIIPETNEAGITWSTDCPTVTRSTAHSWGLWRYFMLIFSLSGEWDRLDTDKEARVDSTPSQLNEVREHSPHWVYTAVPANAWINEWLVEYINN